MRHPVGTSDISSHVSCHGCTIGVLIVSDNSFDAYNKSINPLKHVYCCTDVDDPQVAAAAAVAGPGR
eukprot:2032471-Pyramimonas_sp.AAC.1